jgi:imidazolonepropionase-like amidohydrolase
VLRPGEVLENASVLVRDGRIVRVGTDIALPEGATELKGSVVCASFIDPWSALGVEPNVLADRSLDQAVRTADALDLYGFDHLRGEALRAGVTSVRLQGGWQGASCGLGAVVRLDPTLDEPERVVLLDDSNLAMSVGLSVDQGSTFQRLPDGSFQILSGDRPVDVFDRVSAVERVVSNIETGRAYRRAEVEYKYELEEWQKAIAKKTEELEKDFKKAKKDRDKKVKEAEEKGKEHKDSSYKEDKKPRKPKFDENKATLARVAEGEIPLVVEVHRAAEIRNLLEGTEQFERLRLVVAGGSEALHCAEELAERNIPVIVWPSLRGSDKQDEFSGDDLSLAASLAKAGVQVLLGTGGRSASATRDLPLLAELAVGHGLDRQAAFEALTLAVARTFDLADRLGSVEIGKEADLLVLDGMPLEPNTTIQYVLCGGRLAITPEHP